MIPRCKPHVLFHVLERVRSQLVVAPRLARSLQPLAIAGRIHVRSAQRGAETFETLAHFEQLGDVATGQSSHDGAALVTQLDHPVRVEAQKRFANRAAADVQLRHQLGFDQPLAGRQQAFEDPRADRLRGVQRGLGVVELLFARRRALCPLGLDRHDFLRRCHVPRLPPVFLSSCIETAATIRAAARSRLRRCRTPAGRRSPK